jgi:methylmalonyl-CoA/ethylmalonyl-CoA epimerase
MSINIEGVGQVALAVSDPDRSQEFYGETLGLPLLYRNNSLVFFSTGNMRLLLSGTLDARPSSGSIYFRVEDLDDAHATLCAKGIEFEDGPKLIARMPNHELWMAFFKDPDGHSLALMAEKRG